MIANPQVENGYTKIANEILDALIKIRVNGEARQVLDMIFRKTYGFNKKEDRIALSQFVEATGLKKPTVCKALNKLKEMNLIVVTQKGNEDNIFQINKDYPTWKPLPKKITLPKKIKIVTQKANASLPKKIHTKDNTTKDKKESPTSETSEEKVKVVKFEPEDVEMVELLVSLIQKNNPAWRMKGNPDTWAADMNKLRRIDGYTQKQIKYMIEWTQKDSFWSQNILSASKLREKFNDLIPRLKEIKTNAQKPNYVL